MTIKNTLNAISSFEELGPIVNKAKANLSSWGGHYVTVLGHEGRLAIDDLAAKVIELIKKNPDFDEKERAYGKALSPLISKLYKDSDKLGSGCGLKNFLAKIRAFFNFFAIIWETRRENRTCSKPRWDWEECEYHETVYYHECGYNIFFYRYTLTQFNIKFPNGQPSCSKVVQGVTTYFSN